MQEWIPLIIGLVGALIGSGTTIVTLWLKEKWSYKRDMRKLAFEMATADYQGQTTVFKDRPNFITSLPALASYYLNLLSAAEAGKLDEKKFKELAEERRKIDQVDI